MRILGWTPSFGQFFDINIHLRRHCMARSRGHQRHRRECGCLSMPGLKLPRPLVPRELCSLGKRPGASELRGRVNIRLCHFRTQFSHLFDGVLVDQVVVVLIEGAVEGDAVGLEEQVLRVRHLILGNLLGQFTELNCHENWEKVPGVSFHSLPAGCTLAPDQGSSQYHPAGRGRRRSRWTQRPLPSELPLIRFVLNKMLTRLSCSLTDSESWDQYYSAFDITIVGVGWIDGSRIWHWHFNLSSIFSTSQTYIVLNLTFCETSKRGGIFWSLDSLHSMSFPEY